MECVRGRDHEICNLINVINFQRTKNTLLGILLGRYEDSHESPKKMEILDNGYIWETCQHVSRMLIDTRRCHDEESSCKVLFDLILCFGFLNNIWMSTCKATGTRVVSVSTTSIHVVDENS